MKAFVKSFLALAVLCSAAVNVSATPIVSLSVAGQVTSSVVGATTIDFNTGCGYATCSGDYKIVTGSASGLYAQPVGVNSAYLTVPNPSATTHTASFGLGTTANYFGLLWGSIDSYNSISFFRNNVQVANFTGTDLVGSSANGNQVSYSSNRFINFNFGNDLFDTVKLSSSGFAFESDNHAYATVPEPMNIALLGLGMFGLFAARRLQRV